MHHAVLIFLLLLMFHNCDTSSKFQSTLPRRERRMTSFLCPLYQNFNPHSHEGSDLFLNQLFFCIFFISTHTPTKGATDTLYLFLTIVWISTHTPTKGATCYSHDLPNSFLFQPTLPRRERQQY